MSESDESLFREVDEEVRQDEYKKLWDRHGRKITALAVLIVVAVAAYQGWKAYSLRQAEDAGTIYFDALRKATDGKTDDALAALGAVHHAGFGQMAKLREAILLGAKGDTEKSVAALDAFAADSSNDPALIDVARIRAGYALVDSAKPDELLTRLGRYDNDTASWHNEAREIFALTAWRTKDYTMADRYFRAIRDGKDASPNQRQRAEMMLQLIAPNLVTK
ncbi:MAG: tetratricopeptide repeat protein [Aestuariivirga sp.]